MESRQLIGNAVHRPTNAVPAKEIVIWIAIVLVVSYAEATTAKQLVCQEAIGLMVQIVVEVLLNTFYKVNDFKC